MRPRLVRGLPPRVRPPLLLGAHALVGEEVELRVTRTTVPAPLQAASSAWRIAMAKSWAQAIVS